MEKKKLPPRRWPKILVAIVLGLSLIGLIGWGIKSLMGGKSDKPRKAPVVTLLPDKPPPPPPPPKEEKKPEPKEEKKDVKIEQPKEAPQPAQNEPLKMEGAAGDGESAFGAGTVGRAIRTERHRLVEWKKPGTPPEEAVLELYDYEADPGESRNLASQQPEVAARLRAILARHPEADPSAT